MIILGIETTCDETSVGIVKDGVEVLSNVVSSSAELHTKYGGIVPEVAAREQVKLMVPVVDQALSESNLTFDSIDAISVAYGPGLIGSLLIGVEAAKALSVVWDKPLIAVNHLVGHLYANWITAGNKSPKFPLVALIVSGGHTDLILMENVGKFKLLGSTLDDAAGEVFDKVARVLGLGYPGGPEIERVSGENKNDKVTTNFPRPMMSRDNFNFSFSGLKTSVANFVKERKLAEEDVASIASDFQKSIVDVLVRKTEMAVSKYGAKSIAVGGGVAANSLLRERIKGVGDRNSVEIFFPTKGLSVDNGAMIATAAYFEKKVVDPLKLQANPSLHF